jgi:hypothetical protein
MSAQEEIKLKEPVLEDNYPVFIDYLYVCDGKVVRSDVEGTVADLKRDLRNYFKLEAKVITRCDIVGRQRPEMKYKKICVQCNNEFDGSEKDTFCSRTCQFNKSLEATRNFLESDEGKKELEQYFEEDRKSEEILSQQIERFHKKYSHRIYELIEKIKNKYNSDEYYLRWTKRGIEPPTDLYFFLYSYAEKHCKECTDEKYLNMFTGKAYYIGNHVIQIMHGQGVAIKIDKIS